MKKWLWSVLLVCGMFFGFSQTVQAEDVTTLTQDALDTYKNSATDGYTLPKGSYILTADITLTNGSLFIGADDTAAEVTLDLNGHVLQLDPGYSGDYGSVIRVGNSGSKLTIKDSGLTAEHSFDKSSDVWTLATDSTTGANKVTVLGGVITGGKGTKIDGDPLANYYRCGGGIYSIGNVDMQGGHIIGCTARSTLEGTDTVAGQGGGVYYAPSASDNSFTMKGNATIQGCTVTGVKTDGYGLVTGQGGGVYYAPSAQRNSFAMTDNATIQYCSAKNGGSETTEITGQGGGVCYVPSGYGSSFTVEESATIQNCTAADDGGGVYAYTQNSRNAVNFTMNDDASVQNCSAKNGGGIVLDGGSFTMNDDSQVTDCSASSGCALELRVTDGSSGEMNPSGGTVDGTVLVGAGMTIAGGEREVYRSGNKSRNDKRRRIFWRSKELWNDDDERHL